MLAQKLIVNYGSKLAMQFLQIAAGIIVARIAGPTILGTVAFGVAFVSMFEFLGDLGTGPAHMKLISEGRDLASCISTFLVMKVFLSGFFCFAVFAFYFFQKYVMQIEFESSIHERVIFIMLASVTIQQLLGIPKLTFAARTEQAKYNVPDVIRVTLTVILRVIVILLGFGAVALASSNLIATLFIVPVTLYLFRGYPMSHFDTAIAKQYVRISLPVILMGMSTSLIYYLDKIIVQYYFGSQFVGIYSAGYRIGGLVLMIATSAGVIFLPLFSNAVSKNNLKYLQATVRRFERFSLLFVMPVVLFLAIYADVIINVVLGQQYLPSIPIMSVINIAMFLMMLNLPYGNVLTGMGHFRLTAIINFLALCFFTALIIMLPNPKYLNLGLIGVAIAVLLSNVFIGSLYRYFAKRKCPIIDLQHGVKFVLFGLGNFIVFQVTYTHFSDTLGVAFKLAFIPLYFAVTYSVLVGLGWLRKQDIADLRELINIRKLGRYVQEEIRCRDMDVPDRPDF